MIDDIALFFRAAWATMVDPAKAAEEVIARKMAPEILWIGFVLVSVLGVLASAILQLLVPVEITDGMMVINPITFAFMLAGLLFLTVFMVYYAGLSLGGTGAFYDALALFVWLQAIGLAIRVVQLPMVFLLPATVTSVSLVASAIMIWCMVYFVKVLHGFDGIGKAVLTMIIAMLGLLFAAGMILRALGFQPPGAVA